MKKILYISNISRTVNTFFIPHMNFLVENGFKVDFACKEKGEHKLKFEKIDNSIKHYEVPFSRNPLSLYNFVALYKLYKLQKKEKYDFIHVHTPVASFYTRLLKLKFKNVKMIYTAHGFHFYKGSSKVSWLVFGNIEKVFSKLTDTLVTINDEDFEVAKTFYCKDVRKINGVGVDPNEFRELSDEEKKEKRKEFGIKDTDKVFIMVGEHNKNKNQIMLLRCINEINSKVDNAKFIFIGDGEDLEENKKYVEENSLKNTFILGFRNDVDNFLNISDALISLSYREGLPRNIIEGLRAKKIIIGTNIRGNNELIESKKNGFIISTSSQLVEAIVEVLNISKEEYEEKSKSSYIKYDNYKMDYILLELIKVYLDEE